jgi:hypothetical protein
MIFPREGLRPRINSLAEWKILLGLCAFFIGWRLLALESFEKSGDAVWKWSFLRYFHETGLWYPLLPDHHQGRWAQNLPVLGLMEIFGAQPWVYYILPLLTALGVSLLCYWIARHLSSDHFSGAIAFLLPMFFSHIVNESNQLLPMLPAAFWVLVAVALCFRYFTSGKHPALFFLAGIALGLSWGCKVTSAYWCVGFALFLLFSEVPGTTLFRMGKIRIGWDVILLTLGFFTIFIPETILLNHFFDLRGGRLSMLFPHHLAALPSTREFAPTFLDYLFSFQLPLKLRGKGISFLPKVAFFVLGIWVMLLWLKQRRNSLPHRFFATAFFTAFLLHSYIIVGIHPLRYPERPLGRYFIALSLCSLIATAAGWPDLSAFLKTRIRNRKCHALLLNGLALLCTIFLLAYPVNHTILHGDNIFRVIRTAKTMELASAENLPVLGEFRHDPRMFEKREADRKTVRLWFAFWGPVQRIPEVFTQTPFSLVRDREGSSYNYLWGGTIPTPGETRRCVLVSSRDVQIAEVQF